MVVQSVQDILTNKFREHYGHEVEVMAFAPGRVEVLGNHTDYNEGCVLSAATPFGTCFAIAGREDGIVRLTAGDIMETVEFPVSEPRPSRENFWSNYVKGVQAGLNAKQRCDRGYDAMFIGNIPLGAGLSSSAALEMAAGLAMAEFHKIAIDKIELARIGQQAEHEFAGVRCGLMDQLTSLYGESDSLVWSDFRSLEIRSVSIGSEISLLMCNTSVRHNLNDGAYNERREACERAAKYFATVLPHPVTALRDVSWEEWQRHRGGLDDITARRAAHPIAENERVQAGVEMLRQKNLEGFGKLMFESHESSRRYFENSCPELDTLVDAAAATPGVLGARLSGGGFGGSVVVLVWREEADAAAVALRNVFGRKYGVRCDTRTIISSPGARLVKTRE